MAEEVVVVGEETTMTRLHHMIGDLELTTSVHMGARTHKVGALGFGLVLLEERQQDTQQADPDLGGATVLEHQDQAGGPVAGIPGRGARGRPLLHLVHQAIRLPDTRALALDLHHADELLL